MLSVAVALRHSLIEVASARQALEGQQTKTEMVYQYLTGARFRHRVEAIVEEFSSMHQFGQRILLRAGQCKRHLRPLPFTCAIARKVVTLVSLAANSVEGSTAEVPLLNRGRTA
jgi:hypothetical protein